MVFDSYHYPLVMLSGADLQGVMQYPIGSRPPGGWDGKNLAEPVLLEVLFFWQASEKLEVKTDAHRS